MSLWNLTDADNAMRGAIKGGCLGIVKLLAEEYPDTRLADSQALETIMLEEEALCADMKKKYPIFEICNQICGEFFWMESGITRDF